MRPRLLNLFCSAGGAALGYHRARFEVVGIDWMTRDELAKAIPPEHGRRGGPITGVPSSGRAGRDGRAYGLEGRVWERYGEFAGQARIHGTVMWVLADRLGVIEGDRATEQSEEAPG